MLTSIVHMAVITPAFSNEPLLLHVSCHLYFLGCVYKCVTVHGPMGSGPAEADDVSRVRVYGVRFS